MNIATVSSKRQITLSKNELELINLEKGGKLIKHVQDGRIVLEPLKTSIVDEVAGSLSKFVKSSLKGKPFEEIIRVTKKRVARKLALKAYETSSL